MAFDFKTSLEEHRAALSCVEKLYPILHEVSQLMRQRLANGHTIYGCGNGGSASDIQHFAAELTGRFEIERRGYPAVALTTDSCALTSIGNDYGFDAVFERQLAALSHPGDILLAISTSGNSANVVKAVEYANANQIKTIGLLGKTGGALAPLVDYAITVPIERTARIQEMHILILHLLCESIEV
ncbi:MAG: SIS domain-containing protein [Gammaproteobacteria bacterium]|nr:SIS domain-containing protein [Gammaproteobacteria bacterium]MCF6230419.1 SIS domain-containing protein [Gammaproteobacteria bacterium]